MYPLQPSAVYAWHEVKDDDRCMERLGRVLGGIGRSVESVRWVDNDNMPDAIEELTSLWPPEQPPPGVPVTYARPLVFTKIHTAEEPPDSESALASWPANTDQAAAKAMLGHFTPINPYHPYDRDQEENRVCWPTWDFGTMMGCPHGCHYCGAGRSGKFMTLALNLEQFMEEVVPRQCNKYPWHRCFRLIGWGAEQPAFEPEYGAFDLLTRKLAEHDRYCYFHSGGSHVEWIESLERKDRLIGIFSVSAPRTGAAFEPGAADPLSRFDAGARCIEMGVPVRYKFKPMIPIDGWREDYAQAIDYALRVSRPESMGFCVIMWLTLEQLSQCIDINRLDPEYVEAAREAADEMEGNVCGPFPHHVRREIYQFLIGEARRHSESVKLFISTESREMWDELGEEMGQEPETFFCGCSSTALPGGRVSLSRGCPHSTYRALAQTQE